MGARLPSDIPTAAKWYKIELGGEQSFEIEIRRPTFAEQVASLVENSPTGQMRTRFASMVINWRGVEDEQEPPQPVPFSLEALVRLLEIYPQSFSQINRVLIDMFWTYPEDLRKNLPLPPANGGTTMTTEITNSTR